MIKILRLLSMTVTAWLVASGAALACPVCFGASDSPMAQASNLAILALLGVTVSVLGAFATFFIHLKRRAKLIADSSAPIPGYQAQEGK